MQHPNLPGEGLGEGRAARLSAADPNRRGARSWEDYRVFTASLNLEALQQSIQEKTCGSEGCEAPITAGSEFCAEHAKQRKQQKPRKARKTSR